MIKRERKKLDEKDFLLDIDNVACNISSEIREDLDQKFDELNSEFEKSIQRKKLLRL